MALNDFYLSYKGRENLQGVTTTVVLGNAFDKEYYSTTRAFRRMVVMPNCWSAISGNPLNHSGQTVFARSSPTITGSKIMSETLYQRYEQAKIDHPGKYARDLAELLGISEAELTHARVGHDARRLQADARTLLTELEQVGVTKSITRNSYAVHEQVGRYQNQHLNGHAGLILNPRELDLRLFLNQWASVFALSETNKRGVRHSIQFFDHQGDALHKVYTTDETDLAAWFRPGRAPSKCGKPDT
ncbi:Hemin transport protein hemS [Serratia fonticola]|uniref:Hemin transport protein hemS n=1 Tax=Serratia fonticola TaxID=47917 RepID=A0A4U9WEE9_SERFO|nr:Hemin transport protein hemS [Serratia fonticola]